MLSDECMEQVDAALDTLYLYLTSDNETYKQRLFIKQRMERMIAKANEKTQFRRRMGYEPECRYDSDPRWNDVPDSLPEHGLGKDALQRQAKIERQWVASAPRPGHNLATSPASASEQAG
jgi:hypothetical protein